MQTKEIIKKKKKKSFCDTPGFSFSCLSLKMHGKLTPFQSFHFIDVQFLGLEI